MVLIKMLDELVGYCLTLETTLLFIYFLEFREFSLFTSFPLVFSSLPLLIIPPRPTPTPFNFSFFSL